MYLNRYIYFVNRDFTWKRKIRLWTSVATVNITFWRNDYFHMSEVISSKEERTPRQTTRLMLIWQIDIAESIEQNSIPDANLRVDVTAV